MWLRLRRIAPPCSTLRGNKRSRQRARRAHYSGMPLTHLVVALALAAAPTPDFTPLEFLVGSCWTGAFPGGAATDEHCFEWVFDRKFIRDRHGVRGAEAPYAGETLYAWDARAGHLTWSYWNSEGQVITGTVEVHPSFMDFPFRMETPNGPAEFRARWTRTGADSYRVEQARREGERWVALSSMELRRKR